MVGHSDIKRTQAAQAAVIREQALKLDQLQGLLDYALRQRTDEEREEIVRMGQLEETMRIKHSAHEHLREEVRLLQSASARMELELESTAQELREKSIECERTILKVRALEAEKETFAKREAHLREIADAADARALEARQAAVDRNRDLEDSNAQLIDLVSSQKDDIQKYQARLEHASAKNKKLQEMGLLRAVVAAWGGQMQVAEEKKKYMRALESNWKSKRLHEWNLAIMTERYNQLASDAGQMEAMLGERYKDRMDAQEELEKELHATEAALLQSNEDLFEAQERIKDLSQRLERGKEAALKELAQEFEKGKDTARSMQALQDELEASRHARRVAEEELRLANELLHSVRQSGQQPPTVLAEEPFEKGKDTARSMQALQDELEASRHARRVAEEELRLAKGLLYSVRQSGQQPPTVLTEEQSVPARSPVVSTRSPVVSARSPVLQKSPAREAVVQQEIERLPAELREAVQEEIQRGDEGVGTLQSAPSNHPSARAYDVRMPTDGEIDGTGLWDIITVVRPPDIKQILKVVMPPGTALQSRGDSGVQTEASRAADKMEASVQTTNSIQGDASPGQRHTPLMRPVMAMTGDASNLPDTLEGIRQLCGELGLGPLKDGEMLMALRRLCLALQEQCGEEEHLREQVASFARQVADLERQLELMEEEILILQGLGKKGGAGCAPEASDPHAQALLCARDDAIESLTDYVVQLHEELAGAMGRLEVTVIACKNLPTGPSCTAYALATVDGQTFKTHSAPFTDSPQWHEQFTFFVNACTEELDFSVYDAQGGVPLLLGLATVHIPTLGVSHTPREAWVDLLDKDYVNTGAKALLAFTFRGPTVATPRGLKESK